MLEKMTKIPNPLYKASISVNESNTYRNLICEDGREFITIISYEGDLVCHTDVTFTILLRSIKHEYIELFNIYAHIADYLDDHNRICL
jgi:hypothetical protein